MIRPSYCTFRVQALEELNKHELWVKCSIQGIPDISECIDVPPETDNPTCVQPISTGAQQIHSV